MNKGLSFTVSVVAINIGIYSAVAEGDWLNDRIPGTVSGGVAVTSDYTFRGVSQTKERPAIQGNIDYTLDLPMETSLYLGGWGSNVNFGDGGGANTEFDWYGGLKRKLGDISLDVGIIYYTYPGADDGLNYDYWEGKLAAGYDFGVLSLNASVNYSPEYFGDSGDATYCKIGAAIPLPYSIILDAYIGHQDISDNTAAGLPDYNDWGIGLAYNIKGLDMKAQYIDTGISKTDCADGCDAKIVFTASKVF